MDRSRRARLASAGWREAEERKSTFMRLMSDDLAPITFGQPLRCGMADCQMETTVGLLERDERLPRLFRLLPICSHCLSGLRAGQRMHPRERASDDDPSARS